MTVPIRPDNPYRSQSARANPYRSTATTEPPTWSDPAALARQVAQGVSFGFADELEAGVRAGFTGADYAQVRDSIRAGNRAYENANPGTATVAQIVGGLLTGGGAVVGASRAGANAARVLVPSAARQVGRAMLGATGAGAVTGLGMSEATDAAGMARDAVTGGVVGGLTGGAVAGAVKAVPWAAKRTAALVQGARTPAPAGSGAGRVLDAVQSSGRTLDDVRGSLTEDSRAILAEKIGAPGVETLGSASRLGYEARGITKRVLDARASEEIPLLRRTVVENIAPVVSPKAYAQQKLVDAQQAAKPLYEHALSGRSITDPKVVALLKRPTARKAYEEARRLAQDAGADMPSVASVLGEVEGTPVGAGSLVGRTRSGGARTPSGGLRDVTTVPSEALLDELENLTTRQQRDLGQSVYHFTEIEQRGGNYGVVVPTATKGAQGGPSMQAKAQRRVELTNGVIDRITGELDARGVNWADAMAKRASGEASGVVEETARRVPARGAYAVPEAGEAPSLPTLDAEHIQNWKLALDDRITELEGRRGGTKTRRYAGLVKLRDEVESLLYEHTDGWGDAQAAYAGPMRERDAFAAGLRDAFTVGADDVPQLLAQPNARDYGQGVSTRLVRTLDGYVEDAAVGTVRNPAPLFTGSQNAEARLALATTGDASKASAIRTAAEGVARRLDTRYDVLGNSKTAARVAADGKQLAGAVGDGLTNGPQGVARTVGRKLLEMAERRATGRELDDAARFLLAGAPGQLSIEDALSTLTAAQRQRIGRALMTGTGARIAGQSAALRLGAGQ